MTEPLLRPLQTPLSESTDPPTEHRYPNGSDHRAVEPDRESPPGTPRWVKAFGIIAIVLLLLLAGLHLTGNAPMHGMSSSGTEHGVEAP